MITKRVVPPALMLEGAKVLETVGRLGVMLSPSAAVHVPVLQPEPVFVTPDGTEIVAVLVTCDCAKLELAVATKNSRAHRTPKSIPAALRLNDNRERRLNTFFLLFSKKIP